MIRKKDSRYCLYSKKSGRNLGCSRTKAGARQREREVQYFKSHPRRREVHVRDHRRRAPGRPHASEYARRDPTRTRRETPLEEYRQAVIREFRENRDQINEDVKSDFPEVESVRLTGSVLSKKRFKEDSDVDVAVRLKEGTQVWRAGEIYDELRGSITLGGGVADVVIYVGGKFALVETDYDDEAVYEELERDGP